MDETTTNKSDIQTIIPEIPEITIDDNGIRHRRRLLKPIEERVKIREKKEGKDFNPIIKKAEIAKIEHAPEISLSPESLNVFVSMGASLAGSLLKKESVNATETMNFSQAFYNVGLIHGWWKNVQFLPYLALIIAGTDLTIKIMSKPDKEPKKIIKKETITEKHEPILEQKIDIIDEDKLVQAIQGR